MRFFLFLIFIFFNFFFDFVSKVEAKILINEVMANPSSGGEWIEFYNESLSDASVSGYLLKDQLSSPSVIFEFSDQKILANGFLTIELESAKLNNSADGVVLFNNENQIIDEVSYSNAPSDLTWSRLNDNSFAFLASTKNEANLESILVPTPTSVIAPTPTPTPTLAPTIAPTLSPTPTPTPQNFDYSKIQINEFVACALTNQSEWVEFYNDSDQNLINLDFTLENQNGTKKYFEDFSLDCDEFKSIEINSSFLTNSGGSFKFIVYDNFIEEVSYQVCEKGKSFIKKDGSWLETEKITKNQENYWLNGQDEEKSSSSLSSQNNSNSLSKKNESSQKSQSIKLIEYSLPSLKLTTQKLKKQELLNSSQKSQASAEATLLKTQDISQSKMISVIILGLIFLISGFLGLYVIFVKNKETEQVY
jgi:hypothetical protein